MREALLQEEGNSCCGGMFFSVDGRRQPFLMGSPPTVIRMDPFPYSSWILNLSTGKSGRER